MDPTAAATLAIVFRTAAALLFVEAAVGKLRDRAGFEGVVANYRVLPDGAVGPTARLLPLVELTIAAGLLAGLAAPWPQAAAAGLLMVFSLAMGINLARGRVAIDCGCGRAGPRQPIGWGLVARNLGLGGLLLATAAAPPAAAGAWLLGVAAGFGVFVLDYALSYLASIAPRPALGGSS